MTLEVPIDWLLTLAVAADRPRMARRVQPLKLAGIGQSEQDRSSQMRWSLHRSRPSHGSSENRRSATEF